MLTCAQAYARFPREARDCNLKSLCMATHTVQCIVLDPNSVELAHDLVHLAIGNLGVVRQIRDSDRAARFCRREQLGTTEMVRLSNGQLVSCAYRKTWPNPPDRASSDRTEGADNRAVGDTGGGGVQGHRRPGVPAAADAPAAGDYSMAPK